MTQEIATDKQSAGLYVDSLAELLINPLTPPDVQRQIADTAADLLDSTTGDLYSRLTDARSHIITTLAQGQTPAPLFSDDDREVMVESVIQGDEGRAQSLTDLLTALRDGLTTTAPEVAAEIDSLMAIAFRHSELYRLAFDFYAHQHDIKGGRHNVEQTIRQLHAERMSGGEQA